MKKIYKVLISIIIISMLAAVAISSPTGPYTGCVSTTSTPTGLLYNFQSGSNPTNACKTGDNQITIYEKNYIDNTLNYLQTQINSLGTQVTSITNRVINLENTQSQTFVLGTSKNSNSISPNGFWQDLATWTFYLPTDSYVYVESSGPFLNPNPVGYLLDMDIDKEPCTSYGANSWSCSTANLRGYNGPSINFAGYQMSSIYSLTKGYHTIYLQGNQYYTSGQQIFAWLVTFNVISSQNKIGLANKKLESNNTETITISKDGKITKK